ncbi:unnamed protein product [Paramecium sonneborni]|uniref:Transmembrane protein n=1 Tax=Paramecium sonneborni TaxID=65129 RepID=A0A8S1PWX8_9CILI|nr:unnamed protein product [Paramecium sonneborni]
MKYERFTELFFNFIRRFLFHSAFLLVLPLLFFNAIELQHHKYLKDHNYLKLIRQIDQLPSEQRESITAYLNNEFVLQYQILFWIPLLFVAKEFQEIYNKDIDETQTTQIGLSNNIPPPPPILQPKLISEYVPEKNEEMLQIESYYRNQNQIDLIKNSDDEVKNSNSKSNYSDLINKLQFTIDSKQNKFCQSEYSNKQLAGARHLAQVSDLDRESPQFKNARTQTIKDFSFIQNTQNKIDNQINTKIYIVLSEIAILKSSFGYLVGVQERISISIVIITLSSLIDMILFSDLMLFSNLIHILKSQDLQWSHI